MAKVIIFGDSIACGAWDESGGWAVKLQQQLLLETVNSNLKIEHWVYNLSLPGATTKEVLTRFESELKPRLFEGESTQIIFALGINDSAFNNETKQNQVPLGEFKQNLRLLVTTANKYADKIIFIAPSLVDETKVDPIPWYPPFSYLNQEISKFNQALEAEAKTANIPLVKAEKADLSLDGVHLSNLGHQAVFEAVWPKLAL